MTLFEKWIDGFAERHVRRTAQLTGRRSALAKIGKVLIGGAVLPMLPFDRSGNAYAQHGGGEAGSVDDPYACEYWRNCAMDGFLCTCCGGSTTTCPPGTEVSKVTWVGTCHNAGDGKDYLVSYNDCCGRTACGRCLCNFNEGERPAYRMGVHNDINWCMANKETMYHCTVSVIVGMGDAA
ncbi:MAG: methylamine dehydrogenase light chain [Pseudomonadales bacterium]